MQYFIIQVPTNAQHERDEPRPREKIQGLGLRHIFVQSRFLQTEAKILAFTKTSHTL